MCGKFSDLVAGCDEKTLAAFLGVSLLTFRRYKSGESRPPAAAVKLLRLHLDGDLAAVGGPDWDGFRLAKDGKFYHPFWGRGFTPWQLKALFFEVQDAWAVRRDLAQARAELVAEKQKASAPAGPRWVLVE